MSVTPRVLLVEDNAEDRDVVLLTLNAGGYHPQYRCVADAPGLLSALKTEMWDLALCDYNLPDFDGMGVLCMIREVYGPDIPVIFVSGMIGEETAVELMRAGAQDYVFKSNLARLVPAVRRELASTAAVRETRKTEKMLREAQKMEAVGQFASGIVHDFSNLLMPVIANLDRLRGMVASNVEAVRLVDGALSAAVRGAELTKDLLSFGRQQPLHDIWIDIDHLVSVQVDMLRRLLDPMISIRAEKDGDIWPMVADSNQLQNALMNLALNAQHAMPNGGTIVFKTRNAAINEAAAIAGRDPGDYVVLEVCDTGAGIEPKDMAHVFDPFFTTKECGRGSGLGLNMVRRFVQQSGGSIEVESTLGQGATFRLFFPRAVEKVPGRVRTA